MFCSCDVQSRQGAETVSYLAHTLAATSAHDRPRRGAWQCPGRTMTRAEQHRTDTVLTARSTIDVAGIAYRGLGYQGRRVQTCRTHTLSGRISVNGWTRDDIHTYAPLRQSATPCATRSIWPIIRTLPAIAVRSAHNFSAQKAYEVNSARVIVRNASAC